MSTNKNTLKYLCIVFAFALMHLVLSVITLSLSVIKAYTAAGFVLVFLLICLSIGAASKFTGVSAAFSERKSKAFLALGGLVLTLFVLLTDALGLFLFMLLGVALEKISFPLSMLALPISYFAELVAILFLVLLLCKLVISKARLKFPRGAYMALCFFPPLVFLLFGSINISLIYAFPDMMEKVELGMPAFIYFFVFIKDICIGWSAFCMMKYNQSMRIKALLEMQLDKLSDNS